MIKFYKAGDLYGEFSNFWREPMAFEGKIWPSSEHAFQAAKFAGTEWEEEVRKCGTPMEAATMGRRRDLPMVSNWNDIRDDVMYKVVKAKFTQSEKLKAVLLDTGTQELIEHTVNDSYWADGGDGSGKNMLGIILMKVREEIRNGL